MSADKYDLNAIAERLNNVGRRDFLKTTAAGAGVMAAGGLIDLAAPGEAKAFAYEPYPIDDQLRRLAAVSEL